MFNELNVDNRLRYPVRGRVIVFTNSTSVEFLDNGLKRSFPLFSSAKAYPAGYGICFMVELDGYLTFDSKSHVRISNEFKPFEAVYFDPSAVQVVRPSDTSISPYVVKGADTWTTTVSPADGSVVLGSIVVYFAEPGVTVPGSYAKAIYTPASPVRVADSTGANDATATIVAGILSKLPLGSSYDRGQPLAGFIFTEEPYFYNL